MAPASPDFSGWNWVAAAPPASLPPTAAANGSPCSVQEIRAPAAASYLRRPSAARRSARSRTWSRGDPGEQHRARRRRHGVPAHVRQHAASSRSTVPGHAPQPSVQIPCSAPAANSTCMPTQMPRTGRPSSSRRAISLSPPTARRPAMQAANAPTPGTARPSHSSAASASAVTSTSAPDPGQRALGGAQVPRAVVQHHHTGHHQSTPLVLGMPPARGSGAAAVRSARATALNWASTMWCGLRPVDHPHVQADPGREGQRLEDVPGQRGVVAADHRSHAVRLVVHHVGPPGQVHGGLHQRLVQRHQRVTEPVDAALVAERLLERLAERDRRVLHGVVGVDLGVALGPHGQVEAAVLAQLGQHVVEERDPGADLGTPLPSRSSSTRIRVSLVTRSTRATRLIRPAPRSVPRSGRRGTPPSPPAARP